MSSIPTLYSRWAAYALCAVLFATMMPATNAQVGYQLELKSGLYHFESDFDKAAAEAVQTVEESGSSFFRYLQFDPLPSASVRQALSQQGIELHSYLPSRTWVAELPSGYDLSNLRSFGVRTVAIIPPGHKLSPELMPGHVPSHAMASFGEIDVRILVLEGFQMPDASWLNQQDVIWNLREQNAGADWIELRARAEDLIKIAALPRVRWMEPIPPAPTPDDDEARGLHRNNAIDTDYPSSRQYTGAGVSMAIADDGPVGPHIDVQGRTNQDDAGSGTGSHGDMTVGISMGAGNLNPRYRGMATDVFMYVYGISGYPQINQAVTNLTTRGVHVTSTSYSQGCNSYTTDTRQGDQQIRQNPSLIHVFSAGNSSSSDCGYGVGSGWGNITGGYKQGKNVIATGNLNSSGDLTSSSSRGPASDGRVKPDICANGTNQMSISANNNYQVGGGTSAASPGIAGMLTQLIQAYREMNGGANPETPLLKASMLNTAEDLGNPGPDFSFGWGRVNALRALRVLEENRYVSNTISTGGSNSHSIAVPSNVSEVRFMVYWLDWEGDPAAARSLVNDLNMQVITPSSVVLNPWVLDHTPLVSALTANAAPGVDSVNNVEQVSISNPAAGNYTVNVSGLSVPEGPQKYYVLWEFRTSDIEVTYPLGGEGFVPGETEKLRWDTHGDVGSFTIEYTTNDGASWTTISSSVAGDRRYYDWAVPATVSGECRIRVTRGSDSDESDVNFTIAETAANLMVTASCPTSTDLSWDPVPGATSYEVYMLGATHMESQGTTAGTTFTVTGTNPIEEFWFAVRALGPDGLQGRRTLAIQKAPGVFNCIVNEDMSLVQMLSPGDGLLLDCYDNSNVDVSMRVENTGLNPVASFTVNYTYDGGPVESTTLGPLTPGAVLDYTFPSTIDLSVAGPHSLSAWVVYAPDENMYNDTIHLSIETLAGASTTVGLFNQDMESFASCGTSTNCELEVCNLSGGWINEVNGGTDDIDWRVDAGGTASVGTGPSADNTTGTSTGKYLYLEASGGCENVEARLVSPCIDLSGTAGPILSFYYHMLGADMGELHVDLFDGSTWLDDIMPAIAGDQGSAWNQAIVDISDYAGSTINIRFRGITGSGYESDIALDDISVADPAAPPVVVFSASATAECIGSAIQFTDESGNFPTSWNWSFSPSTVTFLGGTSASSQNPLVSFDGLGTYDVTLTASNGAGPSTVTESSFVSINNGASLPITEDLESFAACATSSDCGGTECPLINGWTNEPNGVVDDIDWRVDAGGTPSTATGPSLDYNPGTSTGQYLYVETSGSCNNQEGHLISPCLDLTAAVNPYFQFAYHQYGATIGSLHLDIYVDDAWTNDIIPAVVGDQGDLWYTTSADLTPYVGKSVKLRLRAITGTSFTSDIALDDFVLEDTGSVCETPVGLTATPTPTSVVVDWTPVSAASTYQLQGRLSPSGTWKNRFISVSTLSQGGLNPGTTYDYRVRVQCTDGTVTPYTAIQSFTTPSSRLAAELEMTLAPVPASDLLNLRWTQSEAGNARIVVTDALGRTVEVRQIEAVEGANGLELDVSSWPAGIYQLEIGTGSGTQSRSFAVHH